MAPYSASSFSRGKTLGSLFVGVSLQASILISRPFRHRLVLILSDKLPWEEERRLTRGRDKVIFAERGCGNRLTGRTGGIGSNEGRKPT